MIANNKFHLLFYLNKHRQKNQLYPLYIRIYVDSARTEIATTHYIDLKAWDSKKMRVKPSTQNALFFNSYIDNVQSKIKNLFIKAIGSSEPISAKILKDKFTGIDTAPQHKTILQAYEYHNLKMQELVKVGKVVAATLKRHEITMNKVRKFIEKRYKTNDKALPELRLVFVTEFEHYLLTVEKIQNNTAHKYIKNLKKIVNMAVGLDWIPSNPFNNFRCSYHSPERDILTQSDLDVLMNKKFATERLREVRDVFIFCCYTGFAYADLYNFEKNAVMIGLDGNYWLSTNRQKTGTKEKVPLLPIALEIIDRYKEHEYCVKYNKLLPVNSNQRYNNYLKELADVCGINKHLTSHIARHTFATTVTLANGVPIETVSAMLGHTSIRTTQIYAKVVESKMSADMELLKAKLFSVPLQAKKIGL
jgi:site-specific recombinase XerD